MTRDEEEELLNLWSRRLLLELGIEGLDPDIDAVLGLAGEAAHGVLRPAAPLTTFLVGFSAGVQTARGEPAPDAVASAIARARRLISDE